MSDTTLNQYVSSGTAAERAAYTPSPPTPASGPDPGYFFFETDTGLTYSWNGAAWVQTGGGGANSVTAAGTLTANRIVLGAGSKAVAELGSLGTTTTVLHGNAAGAPTFGAVVLTTDVSGVLPVANGGTGSASGASIRRTSVTLTDAEVKALPSTPITVVAAPGAGSYIVVHRIEIIAFFSAGAYTNLNATFCSLFLTINSLAPSLSVTNDSTTTPALTPLTRLLGAANRRVSLLPSLEAVGPTGELYVLASTADGATGIDPIASLDNQALTIRADNNGSGAFTGGNAANTMKVTAFYSIEATT